MKNPEIRKTKIVATIGPACDSVEMLQDMIRAGMNVARLNLSHGTHDAQYESLARIREAAALVDTNVAIMIDTRGIEIRTGMLGPESVELSTGDAFTLYTRDRLGDRDGVAVSFKGLAEEVTPGTVILLDDGAIELNVPRSAVTQFSARWCTAVCCAITRVSTCRTPNCLSVQWGRRTGKT